MPLKPARNPPDYGKCANRSAPSAHPCGSWPEGYRRIDHPVPGRSRTPLCTGTSSTPRRAGMAGKSWRCQHIRAASPRFAGQLVPLFAGLLVSLPGPGAASRPGQRVPAKRRALAGAAAEAVRRGPAQPPEQCAPARRSHRRSPTRRPGAGGGRTQPSDRPAPPARRRAAPLRGSGQPGQATRRSARPGEQADPAPSGRTLLVRIAGRARLA